MYISKIAINNFRNLSGAIELDKGINSLVAANGAGKSNFLESIAYLANGGSFRGGNDLDLLPTKLAGDYIRIAALVEERGLLNQIELAWQISAMKKSYFLNSKKTNISQIRKQIKVFIHAPQDIDIAAGPAILRRGFIDRSLELFEPSYSVELNTLKKILTQKNRLLSSLDKNYVSSNSINFGSESSDFTRQMSFWNSKLVIVSSKVVIKRNKLLRAIKPIMQEIAANVFNFQNFDIDINYITNYLPSDFEQLANGESVNSDYEKRFEILFMQKVEENSLKEIAARKSLYGPQRDDIEFKLSARPVRSQSSRGQQRLFSLIAHLSTLKILIAEKEESPILLLDDILSELDPKHQALTLKYLSEMAKTYNLQLIITAPDKKHLSSLNKEANQLDISNFGVAKDFSGK